MKATNAQIKNKKEALIENRISTVQDLNDLLRLFWNV